MSWSTSFQVMKSLRPVMVRYLPPTNCGVLPGLSAALVRFKMTSAKKARDAKIHQVDKEKKYIAKKKKAKSPLEVEEINTIIADEPVDNVWVRKFYPQPRFSMEEAINRHKAFAQPAMLDNLEGLAYLDLLLDFRMKKKTKFMKNIRSTLLLPHPFNWGPPPSILVFCKEEEHTSLAVTLGAKQAGTPTEIIKMMTNGVLNPKDFTHVLATADCGTELAPARAFFRDKFPQRAKDSLGTDLGAMWNLFYNGYTYESQSVSDQQGRLQVPLGQLTQPTEHLVANFEAFVHSICKQKSIALGPFIQEIKVVAPPSPEVFVVVVEDYVPGYKNEEYDSDEEEALLEDKS